MSPHMKTQVERQAYRGLERRVEVLDNETHNSVFPRALSNGLRFMFGAESRRVP